MLEGRRGNAEVGKFQHRIKIITPFYYKNKDTARYDVISVHVVVLTIVLVLVVVLDPFFDYASEHEDDDEYEKQSSIVSIHW